MEPASEPKTILTIRGRLSELDPRRDFSWLEQATGKKREDLWIADYTSFTDIVPEIEARVLYTRIGAVHNSPNPGLHVGKKRSRQRRDIPIECLIVERIPDSAPKPKPQISERQRQYWEAEKAWVAARQIESGKLSPEAAEAEWECIIHLTVTSRKDGGLGLPSGLVFDVYKALLIGSWGRRETPSAFNALSYYAWKSWKGDELPTGVNNWSVHAVWTKKQVQMGTLLQHINEPEEYNTVDSGRRSIPSAMLTAKKRSAPDRVKPNPGSIGLLLDFDLAAVDARLPIEVQLPKRGDDEILMVSRDIAAAIEGAGLAPDGDEARLIWQRLDLGLNGEAEDLGWTAQRYNTVAHRLRSERSYGGLLQFLLRHYRHYRQKPMQFKPFHKLKRIEMKRSAEDCPARAAFVDSLLAKLAERTAIDEVFLCCLS